MAKLFKLTSQWARDDLKSEWILQKIFRKVFRRPKLRRVSEYDNGLRRAINAQSRAPSHHSSIRRGGSTRTGKVHKVIGSRIEKFRPSAQVVSRHDARDSAVASQITAINTEPIDTSASQDTRRHEHITTQGVLAKLTKHAQAVELLEEMEDTTNKMLSECREIFNQIALHRDEVEDARKAGKSADDENLRQSVTARDALRLKLEDLQASYWEIKRRLDTGKTRLFAMLKSDKYNTQSTSTAKHFGVPHPESLREELFGTVDNGMNVSESSKIKSITEHWRTKEILTYFGKCLSAVDIIKEHSNKLNEIIAEYRHVQDQDKALSFQEYEARNTDKASQDSSLARILSAREDFDLRGHELAQNYAKADEDYETVKAKLYQHEHFLILMLKHEIEAVGMRGYLDSIAEVDVEALREELLRPTDPAEGEQPSASQSEEQVDEEHSGKSAFRQERDDARASLEEAHDRLRQHRAAYNQIKANFQNGIDVGVEGLCLPNSATQDDFDIAYLRLGMRRTREVREAEKRMWEAFAEARDAGVAPTSEQCFLFPDNASEGNVSGVSETPEARILAWGDRLPDTPPHPQPDDISIPALSPISLPEPDTWESTSVVDFFLETYVGRVAKPGTLGQIRPSKRTL